MFGIPEIVLCLLVEPALGRRIESDRQTDRHLWADPGTAIQDGGQALTTDTQRFSSLRNGDTKRFQTKSLDETLTYDGLNRMIQAQKTNLATQGYVYDDQGRRIQKTVGGAPANYFHNGPNVYATYGAQWDTPTGQYTHGAGTDEPLLRTSGSTRQFFHQDGLGSVVTVTNTGGTTDSTTRYDAWGNTVATTGTLPIYGYTGREPDETGLIYYRARYYDSTAGRFTQRDPIDNAANGSLYAYANNNPANLVDPGGAAAFFWHGLAVRGESR